MLYRGTQYAWLSWVSFTELFSWFELKRQRPIPCSFFVHLIKFNILVDGKIILPITNLPFTHEFGNFEVHNSIFTTLEMIRSFSLRHVTEFAMLSYCVNVSLTKTSIEKFRQFCHLSFQIVFQTFITSKIYAIFSFLINLNTENIQRKRFSFLLGLLLLCTVGAPPVVYRMITVCCCWLVDEITEFILYRHRFWHRFLPANICVHDQTTNRKSRHRCRIFLRIRSMFHTVVNQTHSFDESDNMIHSNLSGFLPRKSFLQLTFLEDH